MYFAVALTTLLCLVTANLIALMTLVSSAWKMTSLRVERRHRLSRLAVYAVPVSVAAKHLLAPWLSPASNLPWGGAVGMLFVAGILPLLAYLRTGRALEAQGIRDLLKAE